jgi:hypothetical protein
VCSCTADVDCFHGNLLIYAALQVRRKTSYK